MIAAVLGGSIAGRADEYDTLRLKWSNHLTMGTNANPADSSYSGWISSVASVAQNNWTSMRTNATRTYLWNDLDQLGTNSADLTGTYGRLRAMAMGYAVNGSSLEGNAELRGAIIDGLDWMYTNYYNERVINTYDNWYDWEIGSPLNLNDIAVLLYDNLSAGQIANYMNAVDHFTPTPDLTAANRVWKATVVAVRGAIVKDNAKLVSARQSLSDVFPYVTSGDGFYVDGSLVFHSIFSYNGGYGAQLIETIGPLMQLLNGSSWEVTDPLKANLFQWIYDSFDPFIYKGAMMQMVSGRYYSREGDDHSDGHDVIAAILRIAQFAPAGDADAYKSMVKYWLSADSYRNFTNTQPPPFNVWAKGVLSDSTVAPRGEMVRHYQFPHMDRIVHLRPGWAFAVGMSSSRMGNFESIRGENLRGWYTGDGMTCLYNGDLAQFADGFWPTVNAYRLPGTTVDTQTRSNGSGEGYLSPNTWTGGASIQDVYGVAGMQLNAWNSSLAARKSWFMFDNEVVCLGAGITAADNRSVETIIENRRLAGYGNNAFTVNGLSKPAVVGWSETVTNMAWAHLSGNVPGADIGYFFPQPMTVNATREARAGSFYDINSTYGSTNPLARNYLTLWVNHGVNPSNAGYAYVLLPNQSAAQVAGYAANPDIAVLENSTRAQCVQETTLGITAVNFWRDGTNRVGGLTVDRKASVIVRNDGTFLELGIADPTQTNSIGINLEISTAAAATVSADPGITVTQLTPTIRLLANGTDGRTLRARFFVGPAQTASSLPVADAYVQNGDQTNSNFGLSPTLAVKAADSSLTRDTYLRFELPPAPGMIFNATLSLVPVTVNDPLLYHALAYVPDNSWTETAITWNNKPACGPEFTRWALPPVGTPATLNVSALAQQAASLDGKLSFRIYSTATPPPTNGYAAYASKENGSVANRPQLTLDFGRIPPAVTLSAQCNGTAIDAPATVTLEADVQASPGAAVRVDFYSGAALIARLDGPPYAVNVSNLSAGQYKFTAIATDNAGLSAVSAPMPVAVYDPEPIGGGTGLTGDYFSSQSFTGFVLSRVDPTVKFSWAGSPAPSVPADRFSVRWTGKLQACHAGVHQFHTLSDNGVRLWLNGQLLIDNWASHSATEDTAAILLLPGQYYELKMEYYDSSGPAVAQLLWTQPGGTKEIIPRTQLYPADTGLRGDYFSGTNLANAVFSRIDSSINFSWGNSSPDPVLLPGPFSARWTGKVRAEQSGTYSFYTLSANGVRLWVNHQLLVNNWTAHPMVEDSASITLAAGQYYDLSMEYFQNASNATAVLLWMPPGGSKQALAGANLTLHRNNAPPMLTPIPNMSVTRGGNLSFTASASDPDASSQTLSFSLDAGAPAGASINATTGDFTWTPSLAQPPGSYSVTVRVTDNGTPPMTDARTVNIAVVDTTIANLTLIPVGAVWDYLDDGTDPGTAWRSNSFSVGTWKSGAAQLGYGTGRESTLVSFGQYPNAKYITTYFRRVLFVPEAARVQSLAARLLRDDGAVVYINGAEVWRDNMSTGAITSTTLASSGVDGSIETNFVTQVLSPTALVDGTNVIAIEIHQDSPAGADIGFDFELTGVAQVPAEAALTVEKSTDAVILRWPTEAALLHLSEANTVGPSARWTPVESVPEVSSGQCVVRLPLPVEGNLFFRLQAQ